MDFPVKKLLINNFKSFGRAIIEFEHYTVFVTFGEKCVGLIDIIETLQFVLCYNLHLKPKDIKKLRDEGCLNPDRTFVKVQVTHDKSIHTFERAISNNAFEYLYNEVEVSLGEYLTKLTNLSLRNCMSTMFINLDLMNVYVSFSDKDRSNMIEQLCASCLEKPSYDKLNNKLQINKKELNFAMQRQKYLTSQRNELKKRKVLTDNLNNTKRTFEENRREFYYFKLFHNKNAVTDLELELMETQKQYDAFLIQSFNTSNKITQVEKKKHDLCNEIKVSRGALQFSVQMRIKFLNSSLVKKQIGKLENDITDINYVVGQNNVEQIQNTIKILEDRLETIDDAKKMWCTAYNSSKLHEYSKLQMDFEDKFPEMVVKSSSSIYEMKLISIEINRHNQVLVKQKKVLKNLQNLKCKLDSEMVALKDELTKSEQNAKEIHNYGELIEKITTIIGNAKQSRNDEFYNNKLGLKSTQLDNIVNILKSKNPGVYGRVSEFTRSHNAILQDALKCRFGSCYDAIIVDTKETAIECISLLNKLKLTEHNETFLFVPGLKLKDTEHFMVDKEGVKNIKFEYIENVLCDNMESIKNALISCASKTIFCKTYDDAVMVFDLEKNNVNVVSTDEQLLFERSGFITKGSKEAGAEISDAELHDYKVQKLESEVKVRELLLQQKESKIMLMSDIPITEKKLIKILEEISNISKEIENIEKIINKLSKKCDALKLKSNHEENPTEYEFFGEFCKQLNIPNIAEYRQKMLSPNASSTISEINDRWNACKMELDKKIRHTSMLESLKESLNFLLMSLSLKKNDNSRDSNLILNTIHMKRIKQEKLAIELEMSVLKKTEETIYDKLNQKHFKLIEYSLEIEQKLRESYEILLDCKKNMIQLDTVKGTLNDILYLPEDASIDDIMRYRLERIDVNFDDLSDELKNVNVEVTSKTMSENLNEIEAQLKLFPSAESNAAERINFYSNKLMESNIAVKTIKDTVEQDEKEFLIVKNIRMKKFTDCLNELNETILETYIQLKYNNTSTAFFSIVNEDEPFKDGVRLTFWNNPSMEEGEDETFLQALAIMLSVIKYRRQVFVIFADLARFLQPDTIYTYQQFFSFKKPYQLVFFTSRPEFQDNSHYTILQKIPMNNLADCSQSSIIQRTIRSTVYSNRK